MSYSFCALSFLLVRSQPNFSCHLYYSISFISHFIWLIKINYFYVNRHLGECVCVCAPKICVEFKYLRCVRQLPVCLFRIFIQFVLFFILVFFVSFSLLLSLILAYLYWKLKQQQKYRFFFHFFFFGIFNKKKEEKKLLIRLKWWFIVVVGDAVVYCI